MLFVDTNSNIDKEALREFALSRLQGLKKSAEAVLYGQNEVKWKEIRDGVSKTKEVDANKAMAVIDELTGLPKYIQTWIENAVESKERLEFFILTKAEEIAGGDQQHDYYWALQIRHDQIVALVKVVEALIDKLEELVGKTPSEVVDDPVFRGLTEFSIEEQIYLEAEKIHQERKKIMGK